MAVPKKKTSKSKRDKRKATWKHKATIQAQKALSLGKSILSGRSKLCIQHKKKKPKKNNSTCWDVRAPLGAIFLAVVHSRYST
jgi:large subunit ribosomal protein L32